MADIDPTLRTELGKFGFSNKEIDAYLALLDSGESRAAEIASTADVSKRFVYDVMDRFEKKGFVSIHDYETPTTIEPLDPDSVTSQLSERVGLLEDQLRSRYQERGQRNGRLFDVVKSKRTTLNRLEQLIREAEEEILVSLPFDYIQHVGDDLRNAVENGVFTAILIYDVPEEEQLSGVKGLGHVVRTWESTAPLILVGDIAHGMFISTGNPNWNGELTAVVCNNGYLYPLLYPTFWGGHWQFSNEVHLESPSELPRTYTVFIHAVFDALMYFRRGETVLAELSIRPVDSDGEFEPIQGEVIEIKQGLVKPESGAIPMQQSLIINSDGDVFSVSEQGSFVEDYETEYVRLTLQDGD